MALFASAETETEPRKKQDIYRTAAQSFDQYIRSEKPDAYSYLTRGLIRAKLGNVLGAVDDYSRALELPMPASDDTFVVQDFRVQPEAAARVQRGTLYLLTLDAPKLAVRDFEEAIKLQPQIGADAFVGRGLCRALLGRYRDAVADGQEAERRGPATTFVLYNVARIHGIAAHRIDLEIAADRAGSRQLGDLRSDYEQTAGKLLRAALDRLPANQRPTFWETTVQTDLAFVAIRNGKSFKSLASEFSNPAPGGK